MGRTGMAPGDGSLSLASFAAAPRPEVGMVARVAHPFQSVTEVGQPDLFGVIVVDQVGLRANDIDPRAGILWPPVKGSFAGARETEQDQIAVGSEVVVGDVDNQSFAQIAVELDVGAFNRGESVCMGDEFGGGVAVSIAGPKGALEAEGLNGIP